MYRSQVFVLKGFGNCICPVTSTKPNVENISITAESSHVTLSSQFCLHPRGKQCSDFYHCS